MKRWFSKITAFILCMIMLFSCAVTPVQAQNADDEYPQRFVSDTYFNPLYEGMREPDNNGWVTAEKNLAAEVEQVNNYEELVAYVRQQMVNRVTVFSVSIPSATYDTSVAGKAFISALEYSENCSGAEGDALKWGWDAYNCSISYNGYILTIEYNIRYYTTAEQEAELTAAVNAAMAELALDGKSEYEKIKAIYTYICDHVDYDFTFSKYSAYDALCTGTSVCQGYAVLFYRMCKEAGLSVRIITGFGNGVSHAWNIVKIGGKYYNVDATWDGQREESKLQYFLKTQEEFTDHERESDYLSYEFNLMYPMGTVPFIDYSSFSNKLNVNGFDYEFPELGTGEMVSLASDGDAKLLMFYSTSCAISRGLIADLSQVNWSGVDIVAIEVSENSEETILAFAQNYMNSNITFVYEPSNSDNYALWDYVEATGISGRSYPIMMYIDGNNKIQLGHDGDISIHLMKVYIDYYLFGIRYDVEVEEHECSYTSAVIKKSSCSATGVLRYTCSICDAYYDEIIEKTAHKEVVVPGYAATSTSTGLTDGKKCEICGITTVGQQLIPVIVDTEDTVKNGWVTIDGVEYWYENGVRQGYDPNDASYRGKEIYDPGTKAWYWLDNVQKGAKAVSKDVYQESKADEEGNIGKWVRYDENGLMIKGWDTNEAGTYYFDLTYGTMLKGWQTIDGEAYYFNSSTGILELAGYEAGIDANTNGWVVVDGIEYWYENGIRQGYDPANPAYRGKEIYDPGTGAWYWLDNVLNGAKATGKDVYQESKADDAGHIGKWVRYNENGLMIKGWNTNEKGTYYFDLVYGSMLKGQQVIDGKVYYFDINTGILVQ